MTGEKTFSDIIRKPLLPARKGRSTTLVSRRNDCLVARYYYYGYYKNKCYEDTIRALASEFFLSTTTIIALIQSNMHLLEDVKKRNPPMHYLKSHWPHLVW